MCHLSVLLLFASQPLSIMAPSNLDPFILQLAVVYEQVRSVLVRQQIACRRYEGVHVLLTPICGVVLKCIGVVVCVGCGEGSGA